MTTPLNEPLLTVPYVGVDEFRAAPTWIDSNNLIPQGNQNLQDAEMYNVLLRASQWAWDSCDQPLHAHLVGAERDRVRIDRRGRIHLHPKNHPVRSIVGIAFGPDPSLMTVLQNASQITTSWVEDQRGLVVGLIPTNGAFLGNLQFGRAPSDGGLVFVEYSYVAGYANTYLTSNAASGQPDLSVADPTGFMPPATNFLGNMYGASVARIWNPGLEEAFAVSQNYQQGANPVVASTNLVNSHTATGAPKFGPQVSEFPAELRTAVIQYAVALLMREDVASSFPFPGSPGPAARRSDGGGKAGGLIDEAEKTLCRYRRTR